MSKTLKGNFTGEATVYRNDKWGYPVYSVKLSTQKDGEWVYDYLQVAFPKNVEIPNNTEIKINNGFFSFFKKNDNSSAYKLVITSYDIINQAVGDIDIPISDNNDYQSDLPF